jgi:hypothetical protein
VVILTVTPADPARTPQLLEAFEAAGPVFNGHLLLEEQHRLAAEKLARLLTGWARQVYRLLRTAGESCRRFDLEMLASSADIGSGALGNTPGIGEAFAAYLTDYCRCPARLVNQGAISVDLAAQALLAGASTRLAPEVILAFKKAGPAFNGSQLLEEQRQFAGEALARILAAWALEVFYILRNTGESARQIDLTVLANTADIGTRTLSASTAPEAPRIAEVFAAYLTDQCHCVALVVNKDVISVNLAGQTAPSDAS